MVDNGWMDAGEPAARQSDPVMTWTGRLAVNVTTTTASYKASHSQEKSHFSSRFRLVGKSYRQYEGQYQKV